MSIEIPIKDLHFEGVNQYHGEVDASGMACGWGVATMVGNGRRIEGTWYNNFQHGLSKNQHIVKIYFIGVLTLSDDMWFEQEFCDGVNHGKSTNHF